MNIPSEKPVSSFASKRNLYRYAEAMKAGYKGSKLLELWSEPGAGARRSGWTMVTDGAAK